MARAEINALHLELAAQDPVMPILAYRVQYKEAGREWSHAPAVEFKNGTVNPSYTVNCFPVKSQLRFLVIRARTQRKQVYPARVTSTDPHW